MQKEAMLYEKSDNNAVRCKLCAHRCTIAEGQFGFCGVRQNQKGTLYTLVYAEAIAAHIDPIEKKPLYHFFPGSTSFSLATIGCNFRCGFCQNWQISQTSKRNRDYEGEQLLPEEIVRTAQSRKCKSISYTYTEPTIFFEYAFDTAQLAKREGLYNNFVTNGYMTEEALLAIQPFLDAANVDLKSFREDFYLNNCKAHLEPVLESIKLMKKLDIWVEVTTLIIPGQNDSSQELAAIAGFIASVGKDIPWHISRFHPDYKFTERIPTPLESLKKAYKIGKDAGLRYVYMGNVSEASDTLCHSCSKTLIKRFYFDVSENNLQNSRCRFCGAKIDGRF
jgi:pyruvate formate lyase activating enzyme